MFKHLALLLSLLVLSFVAYAAEVAVPGLEAPAQVPEALKGVAEILGNIPLYLSLLVAFVGAALGIALVIPGEQPDKFLQGVVDFLKLFSVKPKK